MYPGITTKDLDNWFSYHAPTPGQVLVYQQIRDRGREFADFILDVCPPCADTTVAIRKLRELIMQINLAIDCNQREPS
jgi:hypothetical protein